jgi:MoaA/NifB/PqqE/SkfB family radical SAM enzyme
MAAGADADARPILQLHSSRHCNLHCDHCYSVSGPHEKGRLGEEAVAGLLDDAWAHGYRVLSVSGGEPLMDPGLWPALARARALGYQTDLVSNGTLIGEAVAARLAGVADLVAISIDGTPERHDAIRRSPGAFERAIAGIRHLRTAGVTVGIIHTVRTETLSELRWLIALARDEGAAMLQLHPIEAAGRAAAWTAEEGVLETRLAMLAELIARDGCPGMGVHCDVFPVAALRGDGAPQCNGEARSATLAELIDPLVVEPDGAVLPWVFGIDRALALGSVAETRLDALLVASGRAWLEAALAHRRRVEEDLADCDWPFVNWFAALAARPYRNAAGPFETGREMRAVV